MELPQEPEADQAPLRSGQGAPLSRVLRPEKIEDHEMASRTRRSFLTAGIGALAGLGAWHWMRTRPKDDDVIWPLRKTFQANERVSSALFTNTGRAPEQPFGEAKKGPRINGDIGLDGNVDLDKYRLHLAGLAKGEGTATVPLDEIRSLPRVETTIQLCCIEGWSIFVNWGGVRFTDFMTSYSPKTRSGKPFTVSNPSDLYEYVAMATPDNSYYVGLDMKSLLHPQTMLAYDIDGQPLTTQHGAPLRLVIPTKYGIKNIKRIGSIHFTADRPADYWAEQGYDWFSGI